MLAFKSSSFSADISVICPHKNEILLRRNYLLGKTSKPVKAYLKKTFWNLLITRYFINCYFVAVDFITSLLVTRSWCKNNWSYIIVSGTYRKNSKFPGRIVVWLSATSVICVTWINMSSYLDLQVYISNNN